MDEYSLRRFLNVRAAFAPSFHPTEDRVAFLMDTTGTSQIWMLDGQQQWPEQLTFYDDSVRFLQWAPSDPHLIFGKDRGGNERMQLYRLNPEKGTTQCLTPDSEAKHRWGSWSPSGDQFAFVSNRRNASSFDVYVQSPEEQEAERILETDGLFHVMDWSPDGRKLLLTRAESSFRQELFVCSLDSGTKKRIVPEEPARYLSACWGPDGKFVYTSSDFKTDSLSLHRIHPEKASPELFFEGEGWNIENLRIHKDSGRLLFSRNVGGYSDLRAGKLEDGFLQFLSEPKHPDGVVGGISFNTDGSRYAVTFTGPTINANVYVGDVESGMMDRWSNASKGAIPNRVFQVPGLRHFESFDGRSIPAFFTLPENASTDDTPVIVDIHGGPASQRRPSFRSLRSFFAHRGYAVFEPNVRGSSGYGKNYMALDDVRNRMDSVKDIKSGVEWLKQQDAVDPDRIIAYGGSYGGFMVLASLVEYPELWAAGVDIVGIANFITFLENTGDWRREHREAEYGSLEEDREFLREISPINHVEKIQAPLLVLHGENDPRVPVEEARQIADRLEERDVPVQLKIFSDEGHGFQKRENRIEAYQTVVNFLDRHV